MKRSLGVLVVFLSLLSASAVVQDQVQSGFGWWIDLRPGGGGKLDLAQTFHPGIAGQLVSIGHDGESPRGTTEYPTTFSIVDTVAGVPGTNILGQSVITNISEQKTVYFTNQSIFLETNAVYAVVISTEGPPLASGQYSFRISYGDWYSGGILLSRAAGGNWAPAASDSPPLDMVFATYMEPGIPEIRIVAPAEFSKVDLGQPVALLSVLSSAVSNATSVDFYASNTLVGSVSSAPYSINWVPSTAGTNALTAVLWKTGGNAVTSAVQHVIVTDSRPPNDDFAQRIALSGEVQTVSINQSNATLEPGEPRPFAGSAGKTVWWQWTPPRTARATALLKPDPQDAGLLSVFTGSQIQSLLLLTNHSARLTQAVQAGTDYKISVDSVSNILVGASLTIALNDLEISAPTPQTVFYAPANFALNANRTAMVRNLASVTVSANGVSLGSLPLDTLSRACTLPYSGYYNLQLAVTDTNGVTTYANEIPVVVRPANDNFESAEILSGRSIGRHTSNLGATMQLWGGPYPIFPVYGEPTWGQNQGGHSIWYRWTAPADGLCVINGAGDNFPLIFNVCLGSAVDQLSVVAANALNAAYHDVEFDAVAGTTYYVSVDGNTGEEGELDWTLQLKPYNDDFASRRLLNGINIQFQDSNAGSTLEAGEAAALPAGAGSSIWYTWQAPVAGQVNITVSGTNALSLAVFQGDSLGNLTLVTTNAGGWVNSPSATFTAQQGVYYQIGLFGPGSSNGTFQVQFGLQSLHIVSPAPNSIAPFPATFHIAAQLDVPGTTLTNVTFKVNGVAVGTATNAPFSLNWTSPMAGTYILTAIGDTPDQTHYSSPPITCLAYADKEMPRPRVFAGVSSDTSYVINSVGALYMFGGNPEQFGRTATNEPSAPFLGSWPAGVTGWKEISGGWAISQSGQLYQNGTTLIPFPAGVTAWKSVSCGFGDCVALSAEGDIYIDGSSKLGAPKPPGGWRDVRTSINSSASVILGLGEDNEAYLVNAGANTLLTRPVGVGGWKRIAQAALFSVLLTTNDELYIYGEYGGVTGTSGTYGWSAVPKPPGVARWVDFATGGFQVLAIGNNGQLYGWGRNWEHQLGLGEDQDTRPTPTLITPPAGVTGWSAVAGGQFHSLAIGNDCSVYAWGENSSGQLGQPSSAPLSRPFRVGTLEALCGTPVIFTDGNASRLPDGSFKLQFNSDLNRSYQIQYSDGMSGWKTANSVIIGTGQLVQWIDDGPPKTDSHPSTQAFRSYRIIYTP
jgi:hypothetical protein